MASLPQRQAPRRQTPPQRRSSTEQNQQTEPQDNLAQSTTSVDSQTLFLNNPTGDTSSDSKDQSSTKQSFSTQQEQSSAANNVEPRRCWICFSDDTDDTPESGVWRTPCPCALTAHESCLLDWIADIEAPGPSRSTPASKKLQCPQCKSEIHLARPRSAIVAGVNVIEKLASRLLLPAIVTGLSYGIVICSSHHGAHTIRTIFGDADADLILAPNPEQTWLEHQMHWFYPELSSHFFRRWRGFRVEFGLPLIPAALIASRTTLADAVLPVLPIIFFATHPQASQTLSSSQYPPSAALMLVILPYLRGIYDEYLERVWGARERAWVKEIQPRLGNEESNNNNNDNRRQNNDEDDVVQVELGIDLEIEEFQDENDDNQPQAADQDQQFENERQNQVPAFNGQDAHEGQQGAAQADGPQQQQNAAQGQGQQQQQPQAPQRQENNILISGSRVAETVIGALLFPSMSATMGEVLRLVLPASLTIPRYFRGRPVATGLLQTRWGRSIIGGCLIVVLKDAVRIYCRWKMAQAFRKRRVLDWDKKAGKIVDPGT